MDNQDNGNRPQTSPNPDQLTKREKVLQPSTQSLQEIRAAQNSEQNPDTHPSDNSGVPPQTTPHLPTPSIPSPTYPEATKGIGVTPLPPQNVIPVPSTEPSPVDMQIAAKILLVRIVGGAILLINAANAYNWLVERHSGYTSWINIIEIVIMLVLAARIFKLSEAARASYVFIAEILVVLTLVGLLLFHIQNHNNPTVKDNEISSLTTQQLQQGIVADEHNPRLSTQQKQQLISLLQNQLSQKSGSTIDVNAKQYLSDALLIITMIGPILFFTRPSIKSVFK